MMKFIIIVIFSFYLLNIAFGQNGNSCEEWKNLLVFGKGKESNPVSQKENEKIESAINCLMSYKRNFKMNEHWVECTNDLECDEYYSEMSIKNYFHHDTNQFTAMYLISAFYFGDFEFAERIEIVEHNNLEANSFTDLIRLKNPSLFQKLFLPKKRGTKITYKVDRKVSNTLFRLYEVWVSKMNKYGLEYMRNNNLNPLKDSNFYWNSDTN